MEEDSQGDTSLAEGEGTDQEGGAVRLAMVRRGFVALVAGGMFAAPL